MAEFASKAPAAQQALVALIAALPELAGWNAGGHDGFGAPRELVPREKTWFVDDKVEDWDRLVPATGARSEAFTLTVWFYTKMTVAKTASGTMTGTPAQVQDEVLAAAAPFEAALTANPTLSGTVMSAFSQGRAEYDSGWADEQGRAREGVLKLQIRCSAHLGL